MKRKICLLLALLILSASAASCGDEKKSDETVSDTVLEQSDSETTAEIKEITGKTSMIEQRASIKDTLPDVKFNGASVRILVNEENHTDLIWQEEDSGDICDSAIYRRNELVEERFDIKFEMLHNTAEGDNGDITNMGVTMIMAGDDAFDLVSNFMFMSGTFIRAGLWRNWYNMAYNDFTQPWWGNGINDKFTLNNTVFGVIGDMCITSLVYTYATYYNMTAGERWGVTEPLFEAIEDGKWTIDYLQNTVKDIYEDIDGNGEMDDDDFYGFTAECANDADNFIPGFDIQITERDSNGIPQLVFNNERTATALEKAYKLYWDTTGSHVYKISDMKKSITTFSSGNALFTTAILNRAFTDFRDMEDDYAIILYPKLDEAQEEYKTGMSDQVNVLGLPMTLPDERLDMISMVVELLNIESYKTVYPTFYESALKVKYSRDEASVAMIDKIIQSRTIDFTNAHKFHVLNNFFRCLDEKQSNFASLYARCEKEATTALQECIDQYFEYADN